MTLRVRLLLVGLALAVLALGYETFRLAELAGRFEVAAREAGRGEERGAVPLPSDRASGPAVGAAAGVATAPIDALTYARLELELASQRQQNAALVTLLEQRNQELARLERAANDAAAAALAPMPEGVRLCLAALREALRQEGYDQLRFLRATALDEHGLHGVEALQSEAQGLSATLWFAGRMTASLDRAAGVLELRFFDGRRIVDGTVEPLPAEGAVVRFPEVDGRSLERRLPALLTAHGDYPLPPPEPGKVPTLDPGTRERWTRSFDRLLRPDATGLRWRVTDFRSLQDGWFVAAELIATDARHHVLGSAFAGRLAVEIDERTGVVSLLLRDGSLRREGVETTIGADGFRMVLPDVQPPEAIDAMLGMVVRR